MNDNITEEFKATATEAYNKMEYNTQKDNPEKGLRFVKMRVDAELVDFVIDHYKFVDVVDMNTMVLYLLKSLGHMERDGYKFSIYRTVKGDDGNDKTETYGIDLHDLIYRIRLQFLEREKKSNENNKV